VRRDGFQFIEDDLARIRRVASVTLAGHTGTALAPHFVAPWETGMVLAHPPDAQTFEAVLSHAFQALE